MYEKMIFKNSLLEQKGYNINYELFNNFVSSVQLVL